MVSKDSNKLLASMDSNMGHSVNIQLKMLEILTNIENGKKATNEDTINDTKVLDTKVIDNRKTSFPKPTIDISKHTAFSA